MAISLLDLVDDLIEGIHKCEECDCFLNNESVKDNLIKHKCLSCNKDYSNKFDEKSKNLFKDSFTFCDSNINLFILLLRKGVHRYG